jgi:hypothetical protein
VALAVDESRRTVTLGQAYVSSHRLVAGAMGSVQILASGRVMVGWGVASYTSKFTAAGELLSEFALPAGMYSYRGLWLPWEGVPHRRPKVAAKRDQQRAATILYASWNGATEVTGWQVERRAMDLRRSSRCRRPTVMRRSPRSPAPAGG